MRFWIGLLGSFGRTSIEVSKSAFGACAGGGSFEEAPVGGRCEPSMGALQNTSLYFEAPAKTFERGSLHLSHFASIHPVLA